MNNFFWNSISLNLRHNESGIRYFNQTKLKIDAELISLWIEWNAFPLQRMKKNKMVREWYSLVHFICLVLYVVLLYVFLLFFCCFVCYFIAPTREFIQNEYDSISHWHHSRLCVERKKGTLTAKFKSCMHANINKSLESRRPVATFFFSFLKLIYTKGKVQISNQLGCNHKCKNNIEHVNAIFNSIKLS